jgi:small-conductance mechanosensitive channel
MKPLKSLLRAFFLLALFFFSSTVFCQEVTGPADSEQTAETVREDADDKSAEDAAESPPASAEAKTGQTDTHPAVSLIDRMSMALLKTRFPVDEMGKASLLIRFFFATIIIVVQILLIKFVWFLFKRFHALMRTRWEKHIRPIKVKNIHLLEKNQILSAVHFLIRAAKWVVTAFLLLLTIPLIFGLFPLTRHLSSKLFGFILSPVKLIALSFIGYIPNLFTIAIIIIVIRYVSRSLKFLSVQIEKQKLVLHGFFPEWAAPTYNILRTLLYAFTVAMIYPYLPGSGSDIFKGVSVFFGLLVSFGSSSVIGNLIAGFVITYMRPFKIGDMIKLNGVEGFVVEKSAMVIRLRTTKNEYITFPNNMALNANVLNYNTSAEREAGLIVYTEITFNYSLPWTKVHELLISAALNTEYILPNPRPYILQTALNDFYANYQLNAFTKTVDKLPLIYSRLHENIQKAFADENIDLTAPHYSVIKCASESEADSRKTARPF